MKLVWPNLENARDLGGLPNVDGRTTAYRALIRSDNHDRLTAEGIAAVYAFRPARIIDVRSSYEATAYPSPFRLSAEYRNCSLNVDSDEEPETLYADYLLIIDGGRDNIGAAVMTLADAPAGPILVHCHAGRDRSGILCALALSVAGVPAEAIADDYARSEGADRQLMVDLLAHIQKRYRSVPHYLVGCGVHPRTLDVIRDRLLAP